MLPTNRSSLTEGAAHSTVFAAGLLSVMQRLCQIVQTALSGPRTGHLATQGHRVGHRRFCLRIVQRLHQGFIKVHRSAPASSTGIEQGLAQQSSGEPARECGVTGDIDVGCTGLFAGKPAPTFELRRAQYLCTTRSSVGAGLPAKAAHRATSMLDVPASSLASQLLHLICAGRSICVRPRSPVGAGLPAKAVCQATLMLDVPASSLASQLLHLICAGRNICVRPDPL
ncbi:hypothetical protein PS710_05479 [Pseudomonas fluorescens]|uniref:Uncharacterized protein n=1 Tax=Pseudomonas fluorescens TaxID=294 RepID=A0A5E7FF73_PSEFL|nr:hypothetical protein PS710_05479 [Pseudomonas fluorescens]